MYRHYVKYFMTVVLFNGAYEVGFLTDLLQMRKWRFREVNNLVKVMQLVMIELSLKPRFSQTSQSNYLRYGARVRAIK